MKFFHECEKIATEHEMTSLKIPIKIGKKSKNQEAQNSVYIRLKVWNLISFTNVEIFRESSKVLKMALNNS